jgi:hypothetical protein
MNSPEVAVAVLAIPETGFGRFDRPKTSGISPEQFFKDSGVMVL